jgi:hypothetical protein
MKNVSMSNLGTQAQMECYLRDFLGCETSGYCVRRHEKFRASIAARLLRIPSTLHQYSSTPLRKPIEFLIAAAPRNVYGNASAVHQFRSDCQGGVANRSSSTACFPSFSLTAWCSFRVSRLSSRPQSAGRFHRQHESSRPSPVDAVLAVATTALHATEGSWGGRHDEYNFDDEHGGQVAGSEYDSEYIRRDEYAGELGVVSAAQTAVKVVSTLSIPNATLPCKAKLFADARYVAFPAALAGIRAESPSNNSRLSHSSPLSSSSHCIISSRLRPFPLSLSFQPTMT